MTVQLSTWQISILAFCIALAGCSDKGRNEPPQPPDTNTDAEADTDTSDLIPTVPCDELLASNHAAGSSTIGCEFFATTLDSYFSTQHFAIFVANASDNFAANVDVFVGMPIDNKGNYQWEKWISKTVMPLGSERFDNLPFISPNVPSARSHRNLAASGGAEQCENGLSTEQYLATIPLGFLGKGAIRLESTAPIVAYQFNPLSGETTYSSDASSLIPVSAWGSEYHVVGPREVDAYESGAKYLFGSGIFHAYAAVVAAKDSTEVTITPSVQPLQTHYSADWEDVVVPGDGQPFTLNLDEGDVVYVHTSQTRDTLTGTTITSDPDHPIAVFSGHQCAMIPEDVGTCDHLEEQLPPISSWGKEFIAARLPVRNLVGQSDPVMWQIYAAEDETEVTLSAKSDVMGLPFTTRTMNRGEHISFYVYGNQSNPGDFHVSATKPIALMQYMTGSQLKLLDAAAVRDLGGDPAMALVPPVDQYLNRYIVLVPPSWEQDHLIIACDDSAVVTVDGEEISMDQFIEVGNSSYIVARIPIDDGVHIVRTDHRDGLALSVAGFDEFDSYAYTAGMGITTIDGPDVE